MSGRSMKPVVAERFESDRPMVRFAVSDTGIGMTEEQLGRLFQVTRNSPFPEWAQGMVESVEGNHKDVSRETSPPPAT